MREGMQMRPVRMTCVVAVVLVLGLPACGERGHTATSSGAPSHHPISAADFDPAHFGDSTVVDNRWFPLDPGTQMVWEGHALDNEDEIPRRVVATVTDLTKVIDGVHVVVVWELDYTDGSLEEAELAFFAQDSDGNVWRFGEYPEEYDGDKIVKTPLWLAGLEGAKAGVAMVADPQPGTPSYAQGWGPQVGWNDRAETYRVDQETCVPVDCYHQVLVMREFSRTEPGAFQLKYYAAGVGNVRVGWGGVNEEEREVLVLTDIVHLTPEALSEVRRKVLEQEQRAYDIRPDVYGLTTPSEPRV
jgi:hypothetical protein